MSAEWETQAAENWKVSFPCTREEGEALGRIDPDLGLDPQPVVWLRAWFRYLRQTGSSFGLITVVDAFRREPLDIPRFLNRQNNQ